MRRSNCDELYILQLKIPDLHIKLNGELKDVSEGTSVLALVQQLKLRPEQVAIELNREVVRRSLWETTILTQDDAVEVVHFVGGG